MSRLTQNRLINLTDTLQLCHQKKLTILLEAVFEGIAGLIWIEHGEAVHSKVKNLSGEKAFFACLRWEECSITELPYKAPPHRTISKSLPHLLLDAARTQDEQHRLIGDEEHDLNNAVQIGKNVWWVGHRKEGAPLQINVFLKKFEAPGRRPIWMLIDPGSQVHFPDISRRISELVDISSIQLFTVNHQDPDVCSNAVFITEMNPKAICVTTETTSRLLVHYGLKKFWFLEDKKWALRLVTGHTLKFFPTPFCHFSGAFGIYDPESGIVFTGDLYGATSLHVTDAPLYAVPEQWDDLVTFHSIYMPCNDAIKISLNNMKETVGTPKMIAPQHGGVLKGDLMRDWTDRLFHLQVGVDLLGTQTETRVGEYEAALQEIMESLSTIVQGFSPHDLIASSSELSNRVGLDDGGQITITGDPSLAVSEMQQTILEGKDRGDTAAIKASFIRALKNRHLPTLAEEETEDQEEAEELLAE